MALVNAHPVRLLASHVLGLPRERWRRSRRAKRPRVIAVDPRDVPLCETRNALEELVHALGTLVPPERG